MARGERGIRQQVADAARGMRAVRERIHAQDARMKTSGATQPAQRRQARHGLPRQQGQGQEESCKDEAAQDQVRFHFVGMYWVVFFCFLELPHQHVPRGKVSKLLFVRPSAHFQRLKERGLQSAALRAQA